jgi:hypothetical protein
LEQIHNETPKNDIKIILGDFNAKIGKEQLFKPIIEMQSKHEESSENGLTATDFAAGKNMHISSTFFPHKTIRKETRISLDGKTKNQFDHVMIDSRHATDISDVRSFRGADCSTDHFLVRAMVKQRIAIGKKMKGEKITRLNTEVLANEEIRAKYKEKIEKCLKEQDLMISNVEECWTKIKTSIKTNAEEVLGERKNQIRNEWFDDECRQKL